MWSSLQDSDSPPVEGRLPNATLGNDHLRQVFGVQMGLSDQDIVALSGGHTLVSPQQINIQQTLEDKLQIKNSWLCFRDEHIQIDLGLKVLGQQAHSTSTTLTSSMSTTSY